MYRLSMKVRVCVAKVILYNGVYITFQEAAESI